MVEGTNAAFILRPCPYVMSDNVHNPAFGALIWRLLSIELPVMIQFEATKRFCRPFFSATLRPDSLSLAFLSSLDDCCRRNLSAEISARVMPPTTNTRVLPLPDSCEFFGRWLNVSAFGKISLISFQLLSCKRCCMSRTISGAYPEYEWTKWMSVALSSAETSSAMRSRRSSRSFRLKGFETSPFLAISSIPIWPCTHQHKWMNHDEWKGWMDGWMDGESIVPSFRKRENTGNMSFAPYAWMSNRTKGTSSFSLMPFSIKDMMQSKRIGTVHGCCRTTAYWMDWFTTSTGHRSCDGICSTSNAVVMSDTATHVFSPPKFPNDLNVRLRQPHCAILSWTRVLMCRQLSASRENNVMLRISALTSMKRCLWAESH